MTTLEVAMEVQPGNLWFYSKLAQVMFTRELARRLEGTGVTANILRVPNVRLDASRFPDVHPLLLKLYDVKQRFAITPEQMAETYVKIAAAPEYDQANGLYFDEKGKPVGIPRSSMDDEACARLWKISAEMTGVQEG